jgi:peroxiredoxin
MDPLIKIGEEAPNFHLLDLQGELHDLESMRGWIMVLEFWSSECDWCERIDRELVSYLPDWRNQVKVWWIASNTKEPQVRIEQAAVERNLTTVLLDPDQIVADKYDAQTTPHFFIVDADGKLRYQGAWDDITFRQRTATQTYVPDVIRALVARQAPEITQTQPYGCLLVRFSEDPNQS